MSNRQTPMLLGLAVLLSFAAVYVRLEREDARSAYRPADLGDVELFTNKEPSLTFASETQQQVLTFAVEPTIVTSRQTMQLAVHAGWLARDKGIPLSEATNVMGVLFDNCIRVERERREKETKP